MIEDTKNCFIYHHKPTLSLSPMTILFPIPLAYLKRRSVSEAGDGETEEMLENNEKEEQAEGSRKGGWSSCFTIGTFFMV